MNGEVIKSFLVGLGFAVDESSLSKFNKALLSATVKVTALYGSIKVMAAGISYGIAKIAEGFEQMGYEFRLIQPTINKVLVLRQQLMKAYSRAGVDIYKAIQMSVKFNMSLTKTQYAFKALFASVAVRFIPLLTKQMDVFREKIYANMPRIKQMLEGFVFFVFKAFDATVQLGNRVWSILSRIYDFFYMLHKATSGWSTVIFGVIAAWKLLNLAFLLTPLGWLLTSIAGLILLWDDFKTHMEGGETLFDWTKTSTKAIALLAVAIFSIAPALFAVNTAVKVVTGTFEVLKTIWTALTGVMKVFEGVMAAVNFVMALNPTVLIIGGIIALIAVIGLLIWKWKEVKAFMASFFDWVAQKIEMFKSGISIKGVLQNIGGEALAGLSNVGSGIYDRLTGGASGPTPLGTQGVQNNQTNTNLQQQTQINVNSTADAGAVGKAVAGEQSRVNFDYVRNLTGATR